MRRCPCASLPHPLSTPAAALQFLLSMGPFTGHKGRLLVDHADEAVRRELAKPRGGCCTAPCCTVCVRPPYSCPCCIARTFCTASLNTLPHISSPLLVQGSAGAGDWRAAMARADATGAGGPAVSHRCCRQEGAHTSRGLELHPAQVGAACLPDGLLASSAPAYAATHTPSSLTSTVPSSSNRLAPVQRRWDGGSADDPRGLWRRLAWRGLQVGG